MEKGEPPTPLGECKSVHPLGRTLWKFLEKLNTEVPSDPAVPYLGTDAEKAKFLKTPAPRDHGIIGYDKPRHEATEVSRTDE